MGLAKEGGEGRGGDTEGVKERRGRREKMEQGQTEPLL